MIKGYGEPGYEDTIKLCSEKCRHKYEAGGLKKYPTATPKGDTIQT
jgi:hypothetical protein